MKALAVFPGQRTVRIVDHPSPALDSPTAVRLRMLEVGVCGTDREICSFEYGTPPPGSDYLVLGHESLGEVVEVGNGVTGLAPGNLAVPMVRRPCPHPECAACRAGRQDFCLTGDYTERGIQGAHGFLAESVVDEARWVLRVPAALREIAVLVEPLTIAEKALLQVWEVQDRMPWECRHPRERGGGRNHRAVVLGAGPVALLGAMALRAAGFETFVYARSIAAYGRAAVLQEIGATGLPAEEIAIGGLAARVGNVDLIYEATGASRLAFDAMGVLGRNGIYVFTGVPGRKAPIELDADLVMRNLVLKNQVVLGTVNAGRDAYEAAIRDLGLFLRHWPQAVRGLITARVPLEGFRVPLADGAGGIKNVIAIAGGMS